MCKCRSNKYNLGGFFRTYLDTNKRCMPLHPSGTLTSWPNKNQQQDCHLLKHSQDFSEKIRSGSQPIDIYVCKASLKKKKRKCGCRSQGKLGF